MNLAIVFCVVGYGGSYILVLLAAVHLNQVVGDLYLGFCQFCIWGPIARYSLGLFNCQFFDAFPLLCLQLGFYLAKGQLHQASPVERPHHGRRE